MGEIAEGGKVIENVWYNDLEELTLSAYTCQNSSGCALRFVHLFCIYLNLKKRERKCLYW